MLNLLCRRLPTSLLGRSLATATLAPPNSPFIYQDPFPLHTEEAAPHDETPYRLLTTEGVRKIPNPL